MIHLNSHKCRCFCTVSSNIHQCRRHTVTQSNLDHIYKCSQEANRYMWHC
jgi:hypothetical protein